MNVSLIEVNCRTAIGAVRERTVIRTNELYDSLLLLRFYMPKGIILTTCNRTEVYALNNEYDHAEVTSLDIMILF